MRGWRMGCGLVLAMIAMHGVGAGAESKNPADYPLRFHIFGRSEVNFYSWRTENEAKGDGRAELYENSEPKGIDFSFDCDHKIRASFGYETYPARWKKPGKELTVLMPVFGEAGKFFTCDFHTDVKDYAYAASRNGLRQEPVDEFKAWMTKVDYDPEHGKDVPKRPVPAPPSQGAPQTQTQAPPPQR
jgi:hypothetical protein